MMCVSITSAGDKAATDFKEASRLADVIELRLDLMRNFDLKKLLSSNKPVIVTNRKGNQVSEQQRIAVLLEAINLGATYVDVEATTKKEFLNKIKISKGKTKVIISHHDFQKTENLIEIYNKIKDLGDVVKIVTHANHINDNLEIFRLIKQAKSEGKKIIAFCTGKKGVLSRLLCERFGSYLTFASLEKGKESAEGQLTAQEMIKFRQNK